MNCKLNNLNKYINEIGLEVPEVNLDKAAKNCMTVGDLIKELESYDPELPILLNVADKIVEAEDSCIDANVSEGPLLDAGTYFDTDEDTKNDYVVILSSCSWDDMLDSDKLFNTI